MNILQKILFTALLLTVACRAAGSRYEMQYITNGEGLSHNSVNCIYMDSRDVLWAGTWDGLNAYNGKDIENYTFNRKDPHSLSNNIVRQIVEQNDSSLWVSTDYGLCRWNRFTRRYSRYYPGIANKVPSNAFPWKIAVTAGNNIVCLATDGMLYRYVSDHDKFVAITNAGMPVLREMRIAPGNILLATDTKSRLCTALVSDNGGEVTISDIQPLGISEKISTLVGSRGIAAAQSGSTIYIFTESNDKPSTIMSSGKLADVTLCRDKVLIALRDGTCLIYNPADSSVEQWRPQKSQHAVFSVFCDRHGIIWLGTDGNGLLAVVDSNSFFNDVSTTDPARCFCIDGNGDLLVGTKGSGILRYNFITAELTPFKSTANGLNSNSVYALVKAPGGEIFIGSDGKGLQYIDTGGKIVNMSLPANLPVVSVYAFCFVGNRLYAASWGSGLFALDIERRNDRLEITGGTHYLSNSNNSVCSNLITSLSLDADKNRLWVGSRGGGVDLLDISNQTFTRWNDEWSCELSSRDVRYMYPAGRGAMWIATGYGLNEVKRVGKNTQLDEFTTETGLLSNTVHAVVADRTGNVWLSTNRGLASLSDSAGIRNYTMRTSLTNNEFCDGAVYADALGRLFFGCSNGFVFFTPQQDRMQENDMEMTLSKMYINNQEVNPFDRISERGLTLAHDEAFVRMEFVVHEFVNNADCQYKYRIAGFADDWIDNGTNNILQLTNLPSGDYTLEVMYTNGNKVWSDKMYSLPVRVLRPWWWSGWAWTVYILLFLLIIGVVYSIVRERLKMRRDLLLEKMEKDRQMQINEERLNFFTNISHEFFTPLTLIFAPAKHLLESKRLDATSRHYVELIERNATRMQKLIDELMEFRKLETGQRPIEVSNVDVRAMVTNICESYADVAAERGIDYTYTIEGDSEFVSDRKALEKIIGNIMSNAFKYTPDGGYIHVVSNCKEGLSFIERNSGSGLTREQQNEIFNRFRIFGAPRQSHAHSTGLGMTLVKSLCERLGGDIEVDSQLGKWVEFSVTLPPLEMPSDIPSRPDIPAKTDPTDSPDTADAPPRTVTVMIVEDEIAIRELLADILSPHYKVIEAGDGQEAIDLLSSELPDVIISDIMMPKVDGITLADKIRNNSLTRHIPVIHLSAKTAVEDYVTSYEHGVDLYIPKPFAPQQVLAALRSIVQKRGLLESYYTSGQSAVALRNGIRMTAADSLWLDHVVAYIENNIDNEHLSADNVADAMHITRTSLYRKIRDITGGSPSRFITDLRLHKAGILLRQGQLTVSEIIVRCGFANRTYFYREFKKRYSCTPTSYPLSDT